MTEVFIKGVRAFVGWEHNYRFIFNGGAGGQTLYLSGCGNWVKTYSRRRRFRSTPEVVDFLARCHENTPTYAELIAREGDGW